MQFRKKGIAHINEATEADGTGDYPTALHHYKLGCECLLTASKYETSQPRKEVLHKHVFEYLARAEQIKTMLAPTAAPVSKKTSMVDGDDEKRRGAIESTMLKVGSDVVPVYWHNIIGLDKAKQALKEAVVLPMRLPHLFGPQRKPWSAILLYGPPGTGKTQLARAVATESKATFFTASSATLMTKWLGESEKAVRDLFASATLHAPSVIFLDEIDALCGKRDDGNEQEYSRRVKTEFLIHTNNLQNVLLLAATNLPWALDPAFRRRFKKRIYIPLPDEAAREGMFQLYLKDKEHCIDPVAVSTLARQTDGYSGSDIATTVEEAQMLPLRFLTQATAFRSLEHGHWLPCAPTAPGAVAMTWDEVEPAEALVAPPMTVADLTTALENTRPTVSPADLAQFEKWTCDFGMEG